MESFLIAIIAVGLFVLALSITLIRKGRNLQSDVGSNDDMKRLGLECTSKMARREEAEMRGEKYDPLSDGGCSSAGECNACSVCDDDKNNPFLIDQS